jgi:hypothetical protein
MPDVTSVHQPMSHHNLASVDMLRKLMLTGCTAMLLHCAQAKKRIPKSLDMSGKAPDDNRDYDDDVINDDVADDVAAEDSDEDYSSLAKKPKGRGAAAAKGKASAKTAAKTKPTVTKARAKK